METVRELLGKAAGLPSASARRDTEILFSHCLARPRSWLYTWPEEAVAAEEQALFEELLARRGRGEPVAYLLGSREFWSLQLAVTDATLIPRPETETLVAWALELPLQASAAVLDLGTGSGAIALAVASERSAWRVTAVDSSARALDVARANAARHAPNRLRLLQSDWFSALATERFELVLANPPYVDPDDPHLERGDLRFEPRSALASPEQGFADLRRVITAAPAHLASGGWLLLEHGSEQGDGVRDMLRCAGFVAVETRSDLAGLERVSGGCLDAE